MTEVDRLSVVYEVLDQRFRAGIRRMVDDSRTASSQLISQANRTETGMGRSFDRIGSGAVAAAASITALGVALKGLTDTADSYKAIENRLRSIGEESDDAAEALLAVAVRSRAPIEELSTSVARLAKATGDGFEVSLRRAETLNKLLAIGGASAGEVSSVMTQLSQAISSGSLQGDELRSLREAAPVELLDAIAAAAGTTREQLKAFGEEGLLTAEIVTTAIDNMAAAADAGFGGTALTVEQAFTNLTSAATVFFGRLDEGLNSTDTMSAALADMTTWLQSNADAAEEMGRAIGAGLETASQYFADLTNYLSDLGASINDTFTTDSPFVFADSVSSVIDFIAELNGVMQGAAAVAQEAFFAMADAVSGGMQGAINSVITAVETMVNGVLNGIRAVASAIDSINNAAAAADEKLPGFLKPGGGMQRTNLAGSVGTVTLKRIEVQTNLSSGGTFSEVYEGAKTAGEQGVRDGINSAVQRYGGNLATAQLKEHSPLGTDLDTMYRKQAAEVAASPSRSGGGGSGGSGGGRRSSGGGSGRSGRAERPFFENIEKDLMNLERQIELVGKSNEQVAEAKARWELLDEAKKRGVTVDAALSAQIDQQAEAVGRLTKQLEDAEISRSQFEDGIGTIVDSFADAISSGEDFFDSLKKSLVDAGLQASLNALKNSISTMFQGASGGGGLFSNFLGNIFGGRSFDGGGFTGYAPRSGGIDGKGGMPAIIHPNETVIDHAKGQRIGGSGSVSLSIDLRGTTGDRELDAKIARAGQQILAQVPDVMSNSQKRRG